MMKGSEPLSESDRGHTPSRPLLTIGQALGRRREELALSREGAAEAVGVSRSTYTGYESDQRRLSPEILRTLATFLSVDLDDVFDLYGATCVAQARRVLFGESPAGSIGIARSAMRRESRSDDTAIVERVYFDADSRDVVAPTPTEAGAAQCDSGSGVLEVRAAKDKRQQKSKKHEKNLRKQKKAQNHKKGSSSKVKSRASKKELKKAKSKRDKSKKRR